MGTNSNCTASCLVASNSGVGGRCCAILSSRWSELEREAAAHAEALARELEGESVGTATGKNKKGKKKKKNLKPAAAHTEDRPHVTDAAAQEPPVSSRVETQAEEGSTSLEAAAVSSQRPVVQKTASEAEHDPDSSGGGWEVAKGRGSRKGVAAVEASPRQRRTESSRRGASSSHKPEPQDTQWRQRSDQGRSNTALAFKPTEVQASAAQSSTVKADVLLEGNTSAATNVELPAATSTSECAPTADSILATPAAGEDDASTDVQQVRSRASSTSSYAAMVNKPPPQSKCEVSTTATETDDGSCLKEAASLTKMLEVAAQRLNLLAAEKEDLISAARQVSIPYAAMGHSIML